jgi:putative sigma-54 modulation protein
MQISTTARHCELDAQVRTYAQQRLAKLERFARDIQEAHLVLSAEKFRHQAEITLHLKHHQLVSREESDSHRTAIDLAAQRLEQQLRHLKDRRTEHNRAGKNGPLTEPAPESDLDEDLDLPTGTSDQ